MSDIRNYINQTIKVIHKEDSEDVHTGILRDVRSVQGDKYNTFDTFALDSAHERYYVSEYFVIPVEVDGRRLPDVPGVYAFHRDTPTMDVTVQLSEAGSW